MRLRDLVFLALGMLVGLNLWGIVLAIRDWRK
jgi:hypothetical protein